MKETKVKVICNEDDGRIKVKNMIKIVETVRDSNSKCLITRGYKTADAGSILMLMSLGIKHGDEVVIKCDDEKCVLDIMDILHEKLPVIFEVIGE